MTNPALASGRVAVVTGGASGIGLAAATRFASLGLKICICDLDEGALDDAKAELGAASGRPDDILALRTDVSRIERSRSCAERLSIASARFPSS